MFFGCFFVTDCIMIVHFFIFFVCVIAYVMIVQVFLFLFCDSLCNDSARFSCHSLCNDSARCHKGNLAALKGEPM